MSAMVACRRLATAAESSAASTATRPATRCSPPAKRSVAAASALRAEGRLISRWLSSSLASPVSAMQVLLARGVGGARRRVWGPRSRFDIAVDVVEQVAVGGGQPHRVVPGSAVACADLPQQGADPAALGRLGQCQGVLQGGGIGDQARKSVVWGE